MMNIQTIRPDEEIGDIEITYGVNTKGNQVRTTTYPDGYAEIDTICVDESRMFRVCVDVCRQSTTIERPTYFGYRCEVADHEYDSYWSGVVRVPRWHPVRSVGLDDMLVLMMTRGEWHVFIEGDYTYLGAITAVHVAASRLRRMQDEWDLRSPYERDYRIW